MRIEITLMPVDIAKAYFEILRLRKAVRKAELAFRISFARPPSRPRHSGRTNARGLAGDQSTNASFKTVRN
jgi:hypothetical protein